MKLLSDQPFWPIQDGLPASYPPLDRNVRTDVVIIGAGITGALVAWHLANAGIETVVIDRREVAHGSTAGSTALLQYEIDLPLYELTKRLGIVRATRAYRECLNAIHELARLVKRLKIDCGFEYKGSLLLASERSHLTRLRREYDARREAGFKVAWWTQADLSRRSSLPQPAAIFSSPREAAHVDAYALTYGLLASAAQQGVKIYDQTTVVRKQISSRGVELFTNRGAKIRAKWLVVASGYEADQFLPEPVTTLHSTFALASEPLEKLPGWPAGGPVIWETADPYIYLRTTSDGRIIMGGYDEPFRDPVRRDRLLPSKAGILLRRFRQLFPDIPIEVATAWAGTFGKTKDGLPFIGQHPAVPHTWFALGYGGNGITYSLIAAKLFLERLTTRRRGRDAALYGFERVPDARPK